MKPITLTIQVHVHDSHAQMFILGDLNDTNLICESTHNKGIYTSMSSTPSMEDALRQQILQDLVFLTTSSTAAPRMPGQIQQGLASLSTSSTTSPRIHGRASLSPRPASTKGRSAQWEVEPVDEPRPLIVLLAPPPDQGVWGGEGECDC